MVHQSVAFRGTFHASQLALDSKSPERVRKLVISHSHLNLLIESLVSTRTRRRLRNIRKLSLIVECVCPSRLPPRTFCYSPVPFSLGITCAGLSSVAVISSPRWRSLIVLKFSPLSWLDGYSWLNEWASSVKYDSKMVNIGVQDVQRREWSFWMSKDHGFGSNLPFPSLSL